MEYHKTMFELHQRVNPREVIVGWYATGAEITEHSSLIHDFYARETEGSKSEPVHVLVDTSLKSSRINISAVVSAPMGVPTKLPDGTVEAAAGKLFIPVRCDVLYHDSERMAGICFMSDLIISSNLIYTGN